MQLQPKDTVTQTAPQLAGIPDTPTMSPKAVFSLFGLAENSGYRAVVEGNFPVRPIRLTRRRYTFATAEVRRVLFGDLFGRNRGDPEASARGAGRPRSEGVGPGLPDPTPELGQLP